MCAQLGLLCLFDELTLQSLWNIFFILVIHLILKSDINTASSDFLSLGFVRDIIFCHFSFNLSMSLYLKHVSCKPHVIRTCFFISLIIFLSIIVISLFTFTVNIYMIGYKSVILLFVFICPTFSICWSFFLIFFLTEKLLVLYQLTMPFFFFGSFSRNNNVHFYLIKICHGLISYHSSCNVRLL